MQWKRLIALLTGGQVSSVKARGQSAFGLFKNSFEICERAEWVHREAASK